MPQLWHFAEYRDFEHLRFQADQVTGAFHTAALVIGDALGEKQHRHERVDSAFPGIARFGFEITTKDLVRTLGEAESHLAVMALTYVLTIYERYAKQMLLRLHGEGVVPHRPRDIERLMLGGIHDPLTKAGIKLGAQEVELFDFGRLIRNQMVHAGGEVGDLPVRYGAMAPAHRAAWEQKVGRPFADCVVGNRVVLSVRETFAIFGTVKRLAGAINAGVQPLVSMRSWHRELVADYRAQARNHSRVPDLFVASVTSYSRFQYPGLVVDRQLVLAELAALPPSRRQQRLARWRARHPKQEAPQGSSTGAVGSTDRAPTHR